jgi:hypothetical protein
MSKKDKPAEYKKATAADRKRGVQPTIPKTYTPRPQTRGRRHPGAK